jgi:hypothetical protein
MAEWDKKELLLKSKLFLTMIDQIMLEEPNDDHFMSHANRLSVKLEDLIYYLENKNV